MISGQRQQQSAISRQQTCTDHSLLSPSETLYTPTHTKQSTHMHSHTLVHINTRMHGLIRLCTNEHIADLRQREKRKEGVHFLFRSYFHIIFYKFPPILSAAAYWSHIALQTPSLQLPSSLKECALAISRLSSFSFHLTCSLQPGMWMAKTCKRLEETKKRRRSG